MTEDTLPSLYLKNSNRTVTVLAKLNCHYSNSHREKLFIIDIILVVDMHML